MSHEDIPRDVLWILKNEVILPQTDRDTVSAF